MTNMVVMLIVVTTRFAYSIDKPRAIGGKFHAIFEGNLHALPM